MAGRPKGQPKSGGRKKGTLNHATADIKALAQKHGPAAIKKLLGWMNDKEVPVATRVAAAKELLDRGYGRPAQTIWGDPDKPHRLVVEHIRLEMPGLEDHSNGGAIAPQQIVALPAPDQEETY